MFKRARRSVWQIPLFPVRIVVTTLVLISEVARPVYRPFVRWMSALALIERFSVFVATLPRTVILVLFVVPFAIAEPLKIYALFLIAQRHFITGIAIIVFAYLMSFVVVERIFHAGREKLLTYAWLRWIMDRVEVVQRWVADLKSSVRASVRHWLRRAA